MDDRIKLAEAMGWTRIDEVSGYGFPPSEVAYDDARWVECCMKIPDPFTDANDDYAVLEWGRSKGSDTTLMLFELSGKSLDEYKIGDYARAALYPQ
jgi:hypothetical protein